MGAGPRRIRVALLLALLPGIVGLALIRWPPAEGLERSGLDLLFRLRGPRPAPQGVCVVAIDLDSYSALGLDPKQPWPRGIHAELIRTLAREGAKAIVFDVLFVAAGDPEQDEALRSALADTGKVVIGATVERVEDPLFAKATLVEPWPAFASAAAAVAEVNLPADRDGVIRSAWLAPEGRPGLALAGYEAATSDRSRREEEARFIDYYGPARAGVKTVSLYQALDPGTYLPHGFFRDRIVFVGLSDSAASGPSAKDSFGTPFTGARGETTYGVEIHATIAANLLDGSRIDLLPSAWEAALLVLLPTAALLVFVSLDPRLGAAALVPLAALPWAVAYVAFTRRGLWVPAVIPSAIQLPLAYTASLVWYYLTTARARDRVKRAFAFYLSPDAVRQISEDPSALDLGGEEIVATAMFTDIASFTTVAESMTAHQTAAMLNRYFSEATEHVFETGGTLVKYIGDAVFAIWGAPVRVDDHAARACRTALALARMDARGGESDDPARRLRTRIGVHTGPMLVGNLGSSQRFDYTAIGDAVNLAARIEGCNKMFGTRAVVSAETLAAAGDGFPARRLGRVRVVGRSEPVTLFELLAEPRPELAGFEDALADFERGSFERAAAGFREVLDRSGGADGPSSFYVRTCERLRGETVRASWDGVVTAESK
jgi:adenylate cyclase